MVVKLGNFGSSKEYKTISWKDFKKSEYFGEFKQKILKAVESEGEARILIERILKGGKYPSVAIIWQALNTDKEVIRVKLSIKKEDFKQVLQALGIKTLKGAPALDFVIFKENDKLVYGIDKSSLNELFHYVDKGQYYDLVNTENANSDEPDFDF